MLLDALGPLVSFVVLQPEQLMAHDLLAAALKTYLNDIICGFVTLRKGREVTQGRDLWQQAALLCP